MSTLPFLLSVADELDNINNQSYMDDFGLGFHPHRQFYRTPTIQLSLPAGTEWMEPEGSRHHSRYRSSYRYYGEPTNSLTSPAENDEEDNEDAEKNASSSIKDRCSDGKTGSSGSSTSAQKYVSALNSNRQDDDDKIDNSVQMFNLSKKCSKNYYRHPEPCTSSAATSSMAAPPPLPPRSATSTSVGNTATKEKPSMSYRLHSKCLEGNNSSSEESLQKVTSSIEFLTCFLLKKSRVGKTSAGAATASASAADSKKS